MRASHQTIMLAALLATAVAVPALAQTANGGLTNYPACSGAPSKQDSDQAHSAFLLGKRFFDEADYGSAIHNFVDAYKLDCTKTELLTIIARANELYGNRPEAVHALETYLQRATNASPEDKAQIQRRIDNLKQQIAAQQPTSSATAPTTSATAGTEPTASTTGTSTAPAATVPPPPPVEHSVAPWILVGVGGVAVITGAVILTLGVSKINDASSKCPNLSCPAGTDPKAASDEDSQGRTLAGVGGAVGGVGVAAIAGGIIWHIAEGSSSSTTKAQIHPVVTPGYAGLSVGGRF